MSRTRDVRELLRSHPIIMAAVYFGIYATRNWGGGVVTSVQTSRAPPLAFHLQ